MLDVVPFIAEFGLGCGQPLSMILSFHAAPPGRSAEAIALRLMVSYGSHVMIPPVFGALGAAVGVAPVFWICAMLLGGRRGAEPPGRDARGEVTADERAAGGLTRTGKESRGCQRRICKCATHA